MAFNIGNKVLFKDTDSRVEPEGTCMFTWAIDYCLKDVEYEVIDISECGDLRIKGRLNSNMPGGYFPDEIWVNAEQFELV